MHGDNLRDPNPWSVNWYQVWDRSWKRRTPIVQDSTTLRVPHPLVHQTGQSFEADVRNQFGFVRGVSQIVVTEGTLVERNLANAALVHIIYTINQERIIHLIYKAWKYIEICLRVNRWLSFGCSI